MRKALCVGIDYYEHISSLQSCVSDARSMEKVLGTHGDGTLNFEVVPLYAEAKVLQIPNGCDPITGNPGYVECTVGNSLTAKELKYAVKQLFDPDKQLDIALFYFAGHGTVNANGGYLCASDTEDPTDGLDLDYLMRLARNSDAKYKIIILDSCHSGDIGNLDSHGAYNYLPPNTIIMTACTKKGVAIDGCFTPLMVSALQGGAMNLFGEVTLGSVHSYIDRALGAWDQRPTLKANIENSVCLRKNLPLIDPQTLKEIVSIFEDKEKVLPLDPDYEEDKRPVDEKYLDYAEHNQEKERIMKVLRTYYSLNLVAPEGADYLYWAALKSKGCRLTPLGQYFWQLAKDGRI